MATAPLTQTTGRRKRAVARAQLRPGTGQFTINGKTLDVTVTETTESYDITASIHGGGISGQAGALRMAIARSLLEIDPETRATMKKAGLLTRDSRKKESKKYGLKKARKAPQFTKR